MHFPNDDAIFQVQEAIDQVQKGREQEEVIALVTAAGNVVRGRSRLPFTELIKGALLMGFFNMMKTLSTDQFSRPFCMHAVRAYMCTPQLL